MQVLINGETRRFDAPMSVSALLAALELPATKVAVERNLEIVPRSAFAETTLADGDRIEIVHFVGGG
ncbi:sulfur carrier protein ThiS [Amphiplicatus metriothermophilus]|uniref:Sulfur carrier protein n=1 Tax=Amphiplicatus metriothermophilus TaxID=1519374 RepID=A0A239PW50_9PROT|nr:sulfur carrier protein ThiS [Amphiplicatus metriothermophilus]MBB5519612.1 thiamine biosynthesis protein ThiS [Amphiplicatus metriothermophilus]SNT74176.1 sulfur carrier protein [Amphiplicatus metriothermophilus]